MNNRLIAVVVVTAIIVGSTGYWIGSRGSGEPSAADRQFSGARGVGGFNGGTRTRGVSGSGFITGDILKIDESTITIKTQDGGSKIVLYSRVTPVMKMISGSVDDLSVGSRVSVTGTTNSDGSVAAQNIQLRPVGVGGGEMR